MTSTFDDLSDDCIYEVMSFLDIFTFIKVSHSALLFKELTMRYNFEINVPITFDWNIEEGADDRYIIYRICLYKVYLKHGKVSSEEFKCYTIKKNNE